MINKNVSQNKWQGVGWFEVSLFLQFRLNEVGGEVPKPAIYTFYTDCGGNGWLMNNRRNKERGAELPPAPFLGCPATPSAGVRGLEHAGVHRTRYSTRCLEDAS
jgi:hypothetical protein